MTRSVAAAPPLPPATPSRARVGASRASRPSARPAASSAGAGSADVSAGSSLGRLVLRLLDRLLVLVRLEQVGGVEERALLLADVDEGRLDARQHRLDPTQVDVADRAAMVGPVHQQLDQTVVFQDGHAGFPLAPVDQDLALQVMPSAAAERHHAPRIRTPQHAGKEQARCMRTRRPGGVPDQEHT